MKYVIALLATLFALPALAHGPKVSVEVEPTSGIQNIGDRYSVMLDFDLAVLAEGELFLNDLADVNVTGVSNGRVLSYSSGISGWTYTTAVWNMNSITDVTIAGGSNGAVEGDTLVWNDITNKWNNRPPFRATVTFASGDTTPSVASFANIFMTTGSHSITTFDDGTDGQYFTLYSNGGTTLVDSIGLFLDGSTNFSMGAGDTCTFVYLGTANRWIETGRMER